MKKRLYRSPNNQMLGGVLAGLAEYFNHDPTIWRIAFVVLLIITGFMPGVLIYVIMWIVIPERSLIEPMENSTYTVRDVD